MTRLLVLSDTHVLHYESILLPIREAIASADWVVHCGDFTAWEVVVGLRQQAKNFIGVRGNIDGSPIDQELPAKLVFEIEGQKIGVAHPLQGGPPFPPERMLSEFPQVDIILFGHTHEAVNVRLNHTLVLNPGQAYRSSRFPASYGLITISGDEVSAEIKQI